MNRGKLLKRTNRNICCLCGKLWGIEHFRRHSKCERCKTYVIARGSKGNRVAKGEMKTKYAQRNKGRLTGY